MYDELVKRLREHNGWALNETLDEAADAIEELMRRCEQFQYMPPPAWIPVTERLPEPNTRVIGFMAWKGITAIEYQHGNWYSIDHLQPLPDEAVTHWMPLPEPPRDDKDINVLGKEEGE